MPDTVITVQGRFSAYYPAERATLSLSVGLQGPDRSRVFEATNESAELVRTRIAGVHDKQAGPITSWSSDSVQVWAEKPWNANGLQLDPVFHTRIGFTVKFSDFVHLAGFVEEMIAVPGATIEQVEWRLTEASTSAVLAEVRSRAVKDAVSKASVYAQSIGLGTVRAIALADEGMLSDLSAGGSAIRSGGPMLMTAAGDASGPQLSLKPEDIEVEAVIDARFVAT